MEEVKRIYTLLLHSNGLKIRDIAKELDLDKFYVADILFSTDNIPFWYQDSSSLWFAKEGAIEIDEPEEDQLVDPIVVPKVVKTDRFLQGHSSNSLRSLLGNLSKYRVYSRNELTELFRRYREGDKKARELILKSHQKLVAGIAVHYTKYGIPLEDLIQEGNIGLIRAVERFDYIHFRSFQKYAKSWILQAISASMTTLPYMVRFSLSHLALHRKVRRFKEKYEQQNGFLPSITDIEVDDENNLQSISFLDNLPDNLKDTCIPCENLDVYEDNHNDIWDYEDNEHNEYYVRGLLTHLSKRERDIVIRSYGIGVKEETLEHIGDTHGLTRERVRQIREKAIKKLREFTQSSNDEEQDDSEDEETKEKKFTLEEVERRLQVRKILRRAEKKHSDSSKEQYRVDKVEQINVLPLSHEVSELDGVKVGDQIVYNGKNCTICKIIVRGDSSKLLVEYNNGVLDYVLNKKSRYRSASSQKKSRIVVHEKENRPQFELSTSLDYLVKQNIITNRQLHQCHKKGLMTIGDVKQIIERYKLTPDSTRFTKYTLDMWFRIILLIEE